MKGIKVSLAALIVVAALVFVFFRMGCDRRIGLQGHVVTEEHTDSLDFYYPVSFDYAKTVSVETKDGYREVVAYVPGTRDTLATYILYPRWKERPQGLRPKDIAIAVPVRRLACLSTPQVGTLPLLGAEDRLVGAAKLENINSPGIRQRINEGKIIEVARGISENHESLLAARPEVVLQDLSRMDDQDMELIKVGVNPVLFNSWKEQNLLGRAEWLKLTGLLLGLNHKADSVFKQIEADYKAACTLAASAQDTIPILYGLDYKGSWYMPGEYSYPTAMFRDARVKYDYIPGEVNSTPVSFEYVFSRHRHDKIWISVMTGKIYTKKDFIALNERYSYFDAAGEGGKIFLDRKRVNEYGGNDYWESGPYRPDLILKDIIKMTRPELLPDYELYYFIELL